MLISYWSSDVCSSDLTGRHAGFRFLCFRAWGFESPLPHRSRLIVQNAGMSSPSEPESPGKRSRNRRGEGQLLRREILEAATRLVERTRNPEPGREARRERGGTNL